MLKFPELRWWQRAKCGADSGRVGRTALMLGSLEAGTGGPTCIQGNRPIDGFKP
jgi:hypothetical protein